MENNIHPQQPKRVSNSPSSSMWTLSYRLQGLTYGLIAVALYCYFYLGAWPKYLLIAAAILGYFLGWIVGKFTYRSGK
ncbi:hypothetical protein HOD19_04355 [bacterium]|jgi:hypothetical protein|nr:hypothetical protein [bacterium]MBT4648739.1 hypothetical protein [bacterium]